MEISTILLWTFGLLIYSGPFVPLLAPLRFRRASHARFRRNVLVLLVSTGVHFLSFLPYIIAIATKTPDSLHRLSLAFFVGVLMFLGALMYAIPECLRLRSLIHSHHDA